MRYLSLDVETAHPSNSKQIISVAATFGFGEEPLNTVSWQSHDDERGILQAFGSFYDRVNPDLVFTWRGGGFDLPLITDRYRLHDLRFGLGRLNRPTITYLIDKPAAYNDAESITLLPGRTHFDLALWAEKSDRVLVRLRGNKISLKSVAPALGFPAIAVDTSDMLRISIDELREYNESDALVTYQVGMFALSDLLFPIST